MAGIPRMEQSQQPLEQSPPLPTRPAWLKALIVVGHLALALAMGRAALFLYTRNNDFPLSYHPDESGKVAQLIGSMSWNFKHPLMMLEATNLAMQHYQISGDSREVVMIGRWTSALLASIGVTALAFAGYCAYRTAGLLIGGLTMMLCPYLLVYAHYLKEDASLLGGIMFAIFGARLVISARDEFVQLLATVVMGIGAGAAASGKYVGAGAVVPCLFTLCIARVPHWWSIPTRLVVFAAIAFGTVVFINQRAFADWMSLELMPQAEAGMSEEIEHGQTGHNNLALPTPNTWCLKVASSEVMPHLWAMTGIGALWLIWRRQIGRWGFVLAAFLATFVIELSFNTITFPRYAMPITICLYFVASQLGAYFVHDLQTRSKWGHVALAACVAVIIGFQGRWCMSLTEQFRDDSRQRVREWVAKNVPANARIIADGYADLHSAGDPWRFPNQTPLPQSVDVPGFFASGMGRTPQDLASMGIDYVVTASCSYQRFFEPVHGIGGYDEVLKQNRQFYEDLFQKGQLLWSSKPYPDSHSYVNMEIRVYKISQMANRGTDPNSSPKSGGFLNIFR
jgi:hypothetical protein